MTKISSVKIELWTDNRSFVVYNSAWDQVASTESLVATPAPILITEEGRLSREEAKRQ